MRVPLHFFGGENSPAVKIDKGLISHLVSAVEVSCLPKDLPEFIDVDLSGMTSQTTLRVGDITLPAGVTAVNPETPVATVANVAGDDADGNRWMCGIRGDSITPRRRIVGAIPPAVSNRGPIGGCMAEKPYAPPYALSVFAGRRGSNAYGQ